ncbi:IS3 family transposase [Clostridium pasteurianum]|uniref:IS3 family transposase n=1 Tax=Clostridium pasteurianum TaxID=1501 RepID=UPI0012BBA9EF
MKKSCCTLCTGQPKVIYKSIKAQCSVHSVEKMCKLFHVSRSGYYNWKNDSKCKRKLENEKILKVAQNSHDQNKGIYELDKMLSDVREKFPHCSRKRLYNIQKHNKLYLIRKRKFKATTYSNHNLPVANNLLNQNFNINKPNTVWVTDISYISTREGWLYLAAVKDICTKEIVGWATADNMKTSLCIKALDNAIKLFKPAGWRTHTPF